MNKEEIKRELIEILKIKSFNGQENQILSYLEEKLERIGYDYNKIYIDKDRYNILIDRGDFFICTHVDTVPFDYGIRIENDTIYSIGACDAKANIVSILKFLERAKDLKVSIIFTVDEEGKGYGSETIARMKKFKRGIILEPTSLDLAIASAGSLEYEIVLKGLEAHGSCIEDGVNAINVAFDFISKLNSLKFLKQEHPLVGKANYLIQHISAGSYELVVPDKCKIVIDFRILPNHDINNVREEIETFIKKFNAEYKLIDISYPFETRDEDFINMLRKVYIKSLNKSPKFIGYKSWTDASNFYVYSKASVAIFGPGDLRYAHTRNEHVNINEIIYTIRFLEKINDEVTLH